MRLRVFREIGVIAFLVVLASVSVIPAAAQTAPGGSAVLLVTTSADGSQFGPAASAELIQIGPSGVVRTPLTSLLTPTTAQFSFYGGALRPQGDRAAIIRAPYASDAGNDLLLVDVATGAVIAAEAPGPQPNYGQIAFSPDGTQVAASYIVITDSNNFVTDGGIVIWDAVSGALVQTMPIASLVNDGQPSDFRWAYIGDWLPTGIQWHINCYACEGVFAGEWSLWNPATNAVTPSTGQYFDHIFADQLPATGETVIAVNSVQYPTIFQPGMFPPANTVQYVASGPLPSAFEPATTPMPASIFFDMSFRDMRSPLWVANGSAVLATSNSGAAALIERSGAVQIVTGGVMEPIVGTPTGWLATVSADPQNFSLVEYIVSGGVPTLNPLGVFWSSPVRVFVLGEPVLGATLTSPQAFPIVPPPDPAIVPTLAVQAGQSCPGQPISRLSAGGLGSVTPGTANNLRAEPTTSATVLGLIEPGNFFGVLSGPICDLANGIVWWQVDFQGMTGYTAEIVGGEYAVQPEGI